MLKNMIQYKDPIKKHKDIDINYNHSVAKIKIPVRARSAEIDIDCVANTDSSNTGWLQKIKRQTNEFDLFFFNKKQRKKEST